MQKNYRFFSFIISIFFHIIILFSFSFEVSKKKQINNISINILPKNFIVHKDLFIAPDTKKKITDTKESKNNVYKTTPNTNSELPKKSKKIESSKKNPNVNVNNTSAKIDKSLNKTNSKTNNNSSKTATKNPQNKNASSKKASDNSKLTKNHAPQKKIMKKEQETQKNKEIDNHEMDPISSTLRSLEETSISNNPGKLVKNSQTSLDPKSIIKAKIEENWFHQVNLEKNNITIEILVRVLIAKDKKISNVKIKDVKCSADQEICNILVESAVKAIFLSSPIQELNEEDYELWKDFELLFDPSKN